MSISKASLGTVAWALDPARRAWLLSIHKQFRVVALLGSHNAYTDTTWPSNSASALYVHMGHILDSWWERELTPLGAAEEMRQLGEQYYNLYECCCELFHNGWGLPDA